MSLHQVDDFLGCFRWGHLLSSFNAVLCLLRLSVRLCSRVFRWSMDRLRFNHLFRLSLRLGMLEFRVHLVFSFDDRELALSLFVLLNDFTKHVDIAFKVGHLDSDNGRRTLKVLDS